jgi:hypothetical protein
MTLSLVQARFAYEGIDVGLPALKAALSVSTGVPDWVGHSPDDRVVRLWSPTGITTTSFRVGARLRASAIEAAEVTADAQLAVLFPEPRASLSAVPRTVVPTPPARAPLLTRPRKAAVWLAAVGAGLWLCSGTPDPAVFAGMLVLGPAIAGISWVLARPEPPPANAAPAPAYDPSPLSVTVRVLVLGVFVWIGLAAIGSGTGDGLLAVLLMYLLVAPTALSLVRALVHRRQVNQGLLDECTATAKGVAAQAAFGVGVAVSSVWALVEVSTPGRVEAIAGGSLDALWWPTLAICLAVVGAGTTLAALSRGRAARHYARYRAELDA